MKRINPILTANNPAPIPRLFFRALSLLTVYRYLDFSVKFEAKDSQKKIGFNGFLIYSSLGNHRPHFTTINRTGLGRER